jgi:UV DNA damage endonuclease
LNFWYRLQASFWFVPALMTGAVILFSFITTALDKVFSYREGAQQENYDRLYTPSDLLPVCKKLKIPLVYDLHHHRCLPDGRNVEDTTQQALKTWNREPLFHISSPLCSWQDGNPRNHHDFIDSEDFPESWLNLDITVEVEAKAKELAVIKLMRDIEKKARKAAEDLQGGSLR